MSGLDDLENGGVDATDPRGTDAPPGTDPATNVVLDGAALYAANCASCHGANAEGNAIYSSSIQGFEPIATIVDNGRGDMPVISLVAADVQKIQDFLLTLAAPTDSLDGAGLYARYCAGCHGADASGGPDWATSIQGYEPIHNLVANGRGDMDPVELSDGQISDVQDYLLTLAPALSTLAGPEVYDRLCVGCHGDRGIGSDTKGFQLRYDDDEFSEYWVRAGRATTAFDSAMPDYPEDMISNSQLTEMFTWLNDATHPTDGEGLFNQYCANCHGMDGRGGPSGESILGDDTISGVVRNGKNLGDGFDRRRSYMTAWSAAKLSDEEIQLISSYISSL